VVEFAVVFVRASQDWQEEKMPIDFSAVSWPFVGLMMLLAFVSALLGSLIAYRNPFAGAIIACVLFGAGFIAWNYYPHDFGLPVMKAVGLDGSAGPKGASGTQ
jgi:hypothetical protein